MRRFTLHFKSLNGTLDGRAVTARGLHGLAFAELRRADPAEAEWLHAHSSPKPFALAPLYTDEGELAGLRLTALTDRAGRCFESAWTRARQAAYPLTLGTQVFRVSEVESEPGPGYAALARQPAKRVLGLRFLSPTAFKQGPGSLPLPLPANVFAGPMRAWQAFAPPELALPEGMAEWLAREVFVTAHRIETVQAAISREETFTGFVGEVRFEANAGKERHLQAWQALGDLAAYSGVGHKTTMGMGVVERA